MIASRCTMSQRTACCLAQPFRHSTTVSSTDKRRTRTRWCCAFSLVIQPHWRVFEQELPFKVMPYIYTHRPLYYLTTSAAPNTLSTCHSKHRQTLMPRREANASWPGLRATISPSTSRLTGRLTNWESRYVQWRDHDGEVGVYRSGYNDGDHQTSFTHPDR